jgi:hypothetical protein
MTAAPGARQRERCGRTADLFAGVALVDLEERLSPRSRAVLALLRTRGCAGATTGVGRTVFAYVLEEGPG